MASSSSPSLPTSHEKKVEESEFLSSSLGNNKVPLLRNKKKFGESEFKSKSESKSKSPLLYNNNKNIGSSSSSVGSSLLSLQENVAELIKLELIESNLQLEMLKTQKHADDIMNGLVNHMGFLLLYTIGGLTLQVSDHVRCLGVWFIMLIVTLTFGVGLTMGYKMAKLKLERMELIIKELNQKIIIYAPRQRSF
uniref:Uncharacterized protein n=1 Tax=Solanum tuberosum TaxID=4113 RepID=M1DDN3_SOLTU